EVARPVLNVQKKVVGATFVRFSLASENAAYAETRRSLFWMCLGMASGTVALLVLIARRQIMTPIERLLRAVRQLERGESAADVAVRGNDEIGRLARAFNEMRGAIEDREERLATANKSLQELFDNMRQVIVAVGPDGNVVGAGSRSAADLFGGDVTGRRLVDLLHPGAPPGDPEAQALEQWLDLAFTAPASGWDALAELAPREVVLRPGADDERVLALELRPIVSGDARSAPPSRVMLLATDESEKRRLLREARARGEAHEREMAAMRQLLAGRGDAFATFVERTRERLARCEELCGDARGPGAAAIDELLMHAHTIKGEARAFDLAELAEAMRVVEQQLRGASAAPEAPRHAIDEGLAAARAMVDRAAELFVQVSPHGKDALDRTTVSKRDVARLVELVDGRDDDLGRIAARLASRPFGEAAGILAEKVPTWAEAETKRARLTLEGREVLVPPALARVLGGALTHLARNAVAHGIEAPEERIAKGKPAVGHVVMRCEETPRGPRITVEDDGAGVRPEPVLDRARELGIASDGARAEEVIFAPRFSTRPAASEAAGVGVGLAAVRRDLDAAGFSIQAGAAPGGGARFVITMKG
ncbi:MAG TPA: HAMP domain-containing protein, partial [Minicystis sp.]|nr:HAMP domain-containing protein [Minicystis sp.]